MINISWLQYEQMIKELDKKIQIKMAHVEGSINLIGIPRGGLLVALHLTYLNPKYELLDPDDHFSVRSGTTILVDDVLETGKTYIHWCQALARSFQVTPSLAVLIDKSKCYYGHLPADISAIEMDKKEWITFPYENSQLETQAEKVAYS
jgi:hypoxanthine phosphoribosyltransferase